MGIAYPGAAKESFSEEDDMVANGCCPACWRHGVKHWWIGGILLDES
jgi:hypothetical protein